MTTPADIQLWIKQVMPSADVQVTTEDNHHFDITVIDETFEGMTMLEQHRVVHRALGEKMRTEIHGLSLHTLTPEQAENPDADE